MPPAGSISGADFATGSITADVLLTIEITLRELFCGSWFREADLGFIFGERGAGKTWAILHLLIGIATGRNVGPWRVPCPQKVAYVDGEMPLVDIRDRIKALGGSHSNLIVINHEWLFHKTGHVPNLADPRAQAALLDFCVEQGIRVRALDIISCLFSGIPENDADAWRR